MWFVMGCRLWISHGGRQAVDYGPRFVAGLAHDLPVRGAMGGGLGDKAGLTRFLPATCDFAGPLPQVALVP
jgi:hypothetical protein